MISSQHVSNTTLIEWSIAEKKLKGETVSGDTGVVQPFKTSNRRTAPDGVLVGVIDALGHGDEAAGAAKTAVAILRQFAHESVISLFQRCHEKLNRTRGVVMSLASFNGIDNTMMWLGVGNVEGILFQANERGYPTRERILLRGGVVGYQLPALHPATFHVMPDDMLIFCTDGIASSFTENLILSGSPEQIANTILTEYGKSSDDALALVARYKGIRHEHV